MRACFIPKEAARRAKLEPSFSIKCFALLPFLLPSHRHNEGPRAITKEVLYVETGFRNGRSQSKEEENCGGSAVEMFSWL